MLSSILPCRERVFSAQMIESIVHMIYGATELVFGAGDRTESPKIGSTGKRWGPVWRASCLTEIRVGCKVDTADPAKQNQVEKNTAVTLCPCVLVGGLEHDFFFHIYSESHHPNWRTHIFQKGRNTTNQCDIDQENGWLYIYYTYIGQWLTQIVGFSQKMDEHRF